MQPVLLCSYASHDCRDTLGEAGRLDTHPLGYAVD